MFDLVKSFLTFRVGGLIWTDGQKPAWFKVKVDFARLCGLLKILSFIYLFFKACGFLEFLFPPADEPVTVLYPKNSYS